MGTYIIKRLLYLIPVLLGLTFLTFALTYISPSDPVEMLFESMGELPSEEVLDELREEMGLNDPILVQYGNWLKKVVRGDFGESVKYGEPVKTVLLRKLPNTVKLACAAFLLMLVIALPLGILSAVYHNHLADYIIRLMSFVGISLPSFWVGLMLMYYFAVRLHLLPVSGSESWKNMVMPTMTLAISMAATYVRRIRTAMLEQMNQDYVIGALSKGVSKLRIIFRHVLPNSLLTIVTMLGMSFGGMLGGTMIVESIFSWNGIGKAAVDAISSRDYALIQGYVVWMACIYVIVNLLVDISYRYLDPRIRLGGHEA